MNHVKNARKPNHQGTSVLATSIKNVAAFSVERATLCSTNTPPKSTSIPRTTNHMKVAQVQMNNDENPEYRNVGSPSINIATPHAIAPSTVNIIYNSPPTGPMSRRSRNWLQFINVIMQVWFDWMVSIIQQSPKVWRTLQNVLLVDCVAYLTTHMNAKRLLTECTHEKTWKMLK